MVARENIARGIEMVICTAMTTIRQKHSQIYRQERFSMKCIP